MIIISEKNLAPAVKLLKEGEIILWPSGGVYGLAVRADNRESVKRLYELKSRNSDKPLSINTDRKNIELYAVTNILSRIITENLWPDFIGVILKKKETIPDYTTAGLKTAAFICSNNISEKLSGMSDFPIASTSANLSNEQEIDDYFTAKKYFNNKVDGIIKGENKNSYLNTIIDITEGTTDKITIVRQGKFTLKEIKTKLNKYVNFVKSGAGD